MDKLTVSSDAFAIEGKRVLVRADFNVPLKDGVIGDDTRIRRTLETINYILGKGGSVVAFSHLGRPEGVDPSLSLKPIADRLAELLEKPVKFVPTVTGPEAKVAADALQPGEVMLLENTRFERGEKKNDPEVAKALGALGDCFVNDAFGSSHRAHASTVGVAELTRPAAAGFLVENELKALQRLLDPPQKGFVVILGGAKVADKIDVIEKLLPKCEHMLVCGGMTYAFLSAQGKPIGNSIWWQESEDAARKILATMGDLRDRLKLPTDTVMAERITNWRYKKTVPVCHMRDGWEGLDIGPETAAAYAEIIENADTLFWNGPAGLFEVEPFDAGTNALAAAVAKSKGFTVIGGGDAVAAVTQAGYADEMSHICTGGGASLEFLEGKELPGVAVLNDA